MDEYEKDFYDNLKKVEAFESDLKGVFKKHAVKLETRYDDFRNPYLQILINGKRKFFESFEEVLNKIGVAD